MKHTMPRLGLMLAIVAPVGAGHASANVLPDETDYYADQPVVLSASRLAQPISTAPAAVTVITREMIEASGFRQLVDVLRLAPGFEVIWANGVIPTATYGGLSSIYSRRIQVLVDGRSIYNPAYGQVQWRGQPVALDDVERIEIVRGPNAANDGANAFLASVHITTRHAADSQGTDVRVAAGDHDIRDGLVRHGLTSGDWHWRFTLASQQDDMIDDARDRAVDHLFTVRGDAQLANRDEVMLQAGVSLGFWEGSSLGQNQFSDAHTTDNTNVFLQGRWRRTLDADTDLSVHASHSTTQGDEDLMDFPAAVGLTGPTNLNYQYSRDALEVSLRKTLSPDLRSVWTAEVRHESARSNAFLGIAEPVEGWDYLLSGALEWTINPSWVLHAGAMAEKHYIAGAQFSPRLALNWLPAEGHAFRLGASRAYRSPTILEQYSNFSLQLAGLPPPFTDVFDQNLLSPYQLKPERITSAELGYLLHLPRIGVDLDTRLYHNRIGNLIDFDAPYSLGPFGESCLTLLPPGSCVAGADFTYANLYSAEQTGLEAIVRWQPSARTWLMLTQSVLDTHSDSEQYAESAPHYSASLLAFHDFGWLKASLGWYYQADMAWVSGFALDDHHRVDVRLARDFKLGTTQAEFAVVAQNLGNEYPEYQPSLQFDTRAWATLELHL
jgi:iron complex outermembrane receptor protein